MSDEEVKITDLDFYDLRVSERVRGTIRKFLGLVCKDTGQPWDGEVWLSREGLRTHTFVQPWFPKAGQSGAFFSDAMAVLQKQGVEHVTWYRLTGWEGEEDPS